VRRRRRLGRPATASDHLRPPFFSSEKTSERGERRERTGEKGREERERKRKMRKEMGLNPYILLLTRPKIRGSNRPKPKIRGSNRPKPRPTCAPVLFLFFICCTPLNTCCTPPLHSFIFFSFLLISFRRFFF